MNLFSKREPFLLFFGDVLSFYLALWLTLAIRYGAIPTRDLWNAHVTPFSILFLAWAIIFFVAGLYEKHTLILKSRISSTIFKAQIANTIIAVFFFYLIPLFGITPKTNLFIYLVTSFALILLWRIYTLPFLEVKKKQNAILVGSGEEVKELEREVNNNPRYSLYFISSVDLDKVESFDFRVEVLPRIYSEDVTVVAADFRNEKVEPLLPSLYNLLFSKVKFIDMHKIYEDIFDRIPLSLVKYSWFLENVSATKQKGYDIVKRSMDLILAFIIGIISLVIYPFVYIAIKIEDGGPIFFSQDRVGQGSKTVRLLKFRSMETHSETDGIAKEPKTTKVGDFIRKVRIDELPQLWNVLKGDLSMIGPRPEIPALVKHYEKEIPYYNIRHLIKPGLSGWAQLYGEHSHHGTDVSKTRNKLSYDLYYIKNRSLMLDIKVALRTIKLLISREGI